MCCHILLLLIHQRTLLLLHQSLLCCIVFRSISPKQSMRFMFQLTYVKVPYHRSLVYRNVYFIYCVPCILCVAVKPHAWLGKYGTWHYKRTVSMLLVYVILKPHLMHVWVCISVPCILER